GMFGGGNADQAKMQKQLEEAMERDIPAYRASRIAMVGINLLLGILMLIAGIGLLGARSWARMLGLVTALAAVLVSIGQLVYNGLFVLPATSRAVTEVLPGAMPQGQPGGQEVLKATQWMVTGALYAGLGVAVLVIIYLLIIVLLLVRRDVRAACSGADV